MNTGSSSFAAMRPPRSLMMPSSTLSLMDRYRPGFETRRRPVSRMLCTAPCGATMMAEPRIEGKSTFCSQKIGCRQDHPTAAGDERVSTASDPDCLKRFGNLPDGGNIKRSAIAPEFRLLLQTLELPFWHFKLQAIRLAMFPPWESGPETRQE